MTNLLCHNNHLFPRGQQRRDIRQHVRHIVVQLGVGQRLKSGGLLGQQGCLLGKSLLFHALSLLAFFAVFLAFSLTVDGREEIERNAI